MARVNVETRALAEGRFSDLRDDLGMTRAEAIGMLVVFWYDSQERGVWKGTRERIEKFIPVREGRSRIFDSLLEYEYLSAHPDGEFIIHGNRKHIEALEELSEAGKRGGIESGKRRKEKANENHEIEATLQAYEAPPSMAEAGASTSEPNTVQYNAVQLSAVQCSSKQNKTKRSNTKKESAEPDQSGSCAPAQPFALNLRLSEILRDRKVTTLIQASWIEAYPEPPWIIQEVFKALSWEESNPGRRKKNFGRFMGNWLARGWDRRLLPNSGVRSFNRTANNKAALEEYLGSIGESA